MCRRIKHFTHSASAHRDVFFSPWTRSWSCWCDQRVPALTLRWPQWGPSRLSDRCVSFGFICWHILSALHARATLHHGTEGKGKDTRLKPELNREQFPLCCLLTAQSANIALLSPHQEQHSQCLSSQKWPFWHLTARALGQNAMISTVTGLDGNKHSTFVLEITTNITHLSKRDSRWSGIWCANNDNEYN